LLAVWRHIYQTKNQKPELNWKTVLYNKPGELAT
jgi:hypothetical protein